MTCLRCNGFLYRDLYNEIVCLNCARPQGEGPVYVRRCLGCFEKMNPEAKGMYHPACRPQSRNLRRTKKVLL